MNITTEKQNNLVSLMQAYMLSISGLNQIMGIILKKSEGIMVMNLLPIAFLIVLHFFTSNKSRDLNMDKKALLFVYYIVSVIAVYKYAFRHTTFSYTYALVYCFIPIYLSFYKVNVEKILKYMVFFSALVLPVSDGFFKNVGGGIETIGMSTTYNLLPFIVAAALHFWYYRKNVGILMWIGYIINIYYLIQVIFYGNRGPMVALIVLGAFLILHEFTPDGKMKKSTTKRTIITILLGSVMAYVLSNIEDIIVGLYDWLGSMNIEISALSKSVLTIRRGDLSNGRDWILSFTKRGIKENFLLGNGISTILYNSNGHVVYPHNLFYQLWYDLGIIVSIPMFYLIGKATFITTFKSNLNKEYSIMMMFLFTIAIPRLCFSTEFWTTIPFWFLLVYTISPNIYGMRTNDEGKYEEVELKEKLLKKGAVKKHEKH